MERKRRSIGVLALGVALLLALPVGAAQVKLSNDVAWVKGADEFKFCVYQTYLGAMARLRELAKTEKAGTWCVIADVDETVLGNVDFQIELQKAGKPYDAAMWNEWGNKAAATALPGAKEFFALVKELGGKTVLITNRKNPPLKYATQKNLDAQGIQFDALLMREGPYVQDSSKEMRRQDVEKGAVKTLSDANKLPPLKIIMRFGDQEDDLFDKGATFDSMKERFGKDCVMLPNPMYGDWAQPGVFVESAAVAAAPAPEAAVPSGEAPSEEEGAPAAPAPAAPAAGAITWQEAINKVGQYVVVEAEIIKVYDPESRPEGKGPVKLNVDPDWRNSLTIAFYKKSRSGGDQGFGDPNRFLYKKVRVKGKVEEYKGSKQIMLKSPSDIQIVQ